MESNYSALMGLITNKGKGLGTNDKTTDMNQNNPKQQQSWDYLEFVRCYNQIADEHRGYHFREDITNPEEQKMYYEFMRSPTIRDYALSTFQLDQQY